MNVSTEPEPDTRAPQKRVPDFFIVGHPKSGTTALYDMLKRHPEIFMPKAKEPWFFGDEFHPPAPPRPVGTGWTPRTLEEYLSLFDDARPEQRAGEASAVYLWSRTAAERRAIVAGSSR